MGHKQVARLEKVFVGHDLVLVGFEPVLYGFLSTSCQLFAVSVVTVQ